MKTIILAIMLFCILGCTGKDSIGSVADNEAVDFCGTSTYGECPCVVSGCSGQVCQGKAEEMVVTTCEEKECYDSAGYSCSCVENRCQWVRE